MKTLKLDLENSEYFLICECGHRLKIEPKDFSTDHSRDITVLTTPFTCKSCQQHYHKDIHLEPTDNLKMVRRKHNKVVSIICGSIIAFIALIFIISYQNSTPSSPTFHETGNPNDMTNKEYQQFLEWKEKEKQKEWENQKVFE